jgi:cell division protease FtsH
LNRSLKHLLIWVVTVGVLLMGWKFVTMNMNTAATKDKAITYSELLSAVNAGKVDSVTISGDQVAGAFVEGSGTFHVVAPVSEADVQVLLKAMRDHSVDTTIKMPAGGPQWRSFLVQLLPVLVLLCLFMFLWISLRRRVSRSGGAGQPPGVGV